MSRKSDTPQLLTHAQRMKIINQRLNALRPKIQEEPHTPEEKAAQKILDKYQRKQDRIYNIAHARHTKIKRYIEIALLRNDINEVLRLLDAAESSK